MRTLLIILIVFFVGRWVIRQLAPYLLLLLAKRFANHAENVNNPNAKPRKEGEVNVQNVRRHEKKKINKEVGEYIDFEEV